MVPLSQWPPKPMTSSSSPSSLMVSPLFTAVYMRSLRHSKIIKGNNIRKPFCNALRKHGFRCLASKGRGFGADGVNKKGNNSKIGKESAPVASEPSKLNSDAKPRTQSAPGLTTGFDRKSSNVVLDRHFLEKVETVRRSALEQKKAEENKNTLEIDYDAPIEADQITIGLGTKVGVGIAVVVFGLVFALGDFIPSASVGPNDDTAIVEKKLTDKEKETLMVRLHQYEATLTSSPDDPTALEGAAVTLAELGEYERASSTLEKLIKGRTNDVEAYRLLGEVKYELRDFEGSASAYGSALSASANINFEVLRGLTNSLLAAKKPSEAVHVLLSSREHLNDRNPETSNILTDPNDKPELMQKVDPIQVDLLLGKAYSDWGHVSDAVAVYDQLISKYPEDFRIYLAKGIILKENGKAGDAERMFIQAKYFAPDKAKALVDRYSRL